MAKSSDVGHFVEIMACPGGCLNGGGQIASEQSAQKSQAARRERLQALEEVLLTAEHVAPARHPLVLPRGASEFATSHIGGVGAWGLGPGQGSIVTWPPRLGLEVFGCLHVCRCLWILIWNWRVGARNHLGWNRSKCEVWWGPLKSGRPCFEPLEPSKTLIVCIDFTPGDGWPRTGRA